MQDGPKAKSTVFWLTAAAGVAGLLTIGFLVGSFFNKPAKPEEEDKPPVVTPVGTTVERKEVPNLPPPPKPVPEEIRVRESLKEGRTYITTTRGTVVMRATDKDWGLTSVCTVNYHFTATIERTIEKNDGLEITELRYFKEVKSLKLDTTLQSARLDLGPAGDLLIGGMSLLINPAATPLLFGAKKKVEGSELSGVLKALGAESALVNRFMASDPSAKMFTSAASLQGKKVRLVYRNDPDGTGRGVRSVTAVEGEMTEDERAFHMASSVLSDALIFPNTGLLIGDSWPVDGSDLIGLMDPTLLAHTKGTVQFERGPDQAGLPGKAGRFATLKATSGEITFHQFDAKAEQFGHFRPTGTLYYSLTDDYIVKGTLKGSGRMTVRSRDHMLFEARTDREPEIQVDYQCTFRDPPAK